MTPTQVVGTDLLFGLVLATIGGAFHWIFGSVNAPVLLQLLAGGVPGVIAGCLLARRVPANKLKTAVAMVAIFAGLQLVWTGSRTLAAKHAMIGRHQVKLQHEPAKILSVVSRPTEIPPRAEVRQENSAQ
jgi:hypothetical protein